MPRDGRRRTVTIAVVVLLVLLLLLLRRCSCADPDAPSPAVDSARATAAAPERPRPDAAGATREESDEVLTAATVAAPGEVTAGAVFSVTWSGPDNAGDFVTVRATGSSRVAR